MIGYLVLRDLRLRYRVTWKGYFWAAAQPTTLFLLYSVVFSWLIPLSGKIEAYPLFLIAGILPWTFFHNCLVSAPHLLFEHADLIKGIPFPRVVLPIASTATRMIPFLAGWGILLIIAAATGYAPSHRIWWTPLILLLQTIFTLGLVLISAAIGALYRETGHLMEIFLQGLFFATPIVYTLPFAQQTLDHLPFFCSLFYYANPLTSLICCYRSMVLPDTILPPTVYLCESALLGMLTPIVGYMLFRLLDPVMIKRL
jgi:ABC-type polysaccharide/polyol phosphate export permease